MLVPELSERNAVQVGNPKDRITGGMVNRERMTARVAGISLLASAAAALDGVLRSAYRTPGVSFF